jgi:hypothetical protein
MTSRQARQLHKPETEEEIATLKNNIERSKNQLARRIFQNHLQNNRNSNEPKYQNISFNNANANREYSRLADQILAALVTQYGYKRTYRTIRNAEVLKEIKHALDIYNDKKVYFNNVGFLSRIILGNTPEKRKKKVLNRAQIARNKRYREEREAIKFANGVLNLNRY